MSNKGRARSAVAAAIRANLLPRPETLECEACKARRAELYHHHSYLERYWLNVIASCRSCHTRIHAGSIAEPRTGRIYGQCSEHTPKTRKRALLELSDSQNAIRLLISSARKSEGITQKEAAERIGVTQGYLSHFERGRTVPTRTVADLIIEHLDFSAADAARLRDLVQQHSLSVHSGRTAVTEAA